MNKNNCSNQEKREQVRILIERLVMFFLPDSHTDDNEITCGSDVTLYDRYRFVVPLDAVVVKLSSVNDGVECVLKTSNNPNYPIGSKVWVDMAQLRHKT